MTNEEAIKTIKTAISEVEWNYPLDYAIAFETAINALEKQIPKKPIKVEDSIPDVVNCDCPCCGQYLTKELDGEFLQGLETDYCFNCGQALDWSEG